jgi:hypothetical protein
MKNLRRVANIATHLQLYRFHRLTRPTDTQKPKQREILHAAAGRCLPGLAKNAPQTASVPGKTQSLKRKPHHTSAYADGSTLYGGGPFGSAGASPSQRELHWEHRAPARLRLITVHFGSAGASPSQAGTSLGTPSTSSVTLNHSSLRLGRSLALPGGTSLTTEPKTPAPDRSKRASARVHSLLQDSQQEDSGQCRYHPITHLRCT